MKYLLTHCYSDHNKGDAGIILGAIELIQSIDKNAEFVQMSTFDNRDLRFKHDHYITRPYFKNTIGSLFPEPFIKRRQSDQPNNFKKIIFFLYIMLRGIVISLWPIDRIAKLILNQNDYLSFLEIKKCDYIISKGGSFLYSFKGLKGLFFFLRMYWIFILPFSMKKKVIILGQSIGPLENRLAVWLFKKTATRFHKIFLREKLSLNIFDENGISKSNVDIIPDTAFFMSNNEMLYFLKKKQIKVAITARPHNFRLKNNVHLFQKYIECLVKIIEKMTEQYDAQFYLVPQVIGPNDVEDDRITLSQIYESIDNQYKRSIVFLEDNLDLNTLLSVYSKMTFVIGTRLHSTIFALSQNVPVINISYHGTKSEGVLNMLGLDDYVVPIDNISCNVIEGKLKKIMDHKYPDFTTTLMLEKKSAKEKVCRVLDMI